MNIKITAIHAVTATTEDGQPLGVFYLESEWEGFRKYRRGDDDTTMVVADGKGPMESAFSKLWKGEETVIVVRASPGFALELREKKADLLTPTAQSNG